MNKITSTLAGLAIVATASVVPAFAQGNLFSPPGGFSFTTMGSILTASGSNDSFNPLGSATTVNPVSFTLTGTLVSGSIYSVTNYQVLDASSNILAVLTPGSGLTFVASTATNGGQFISSIGASTAATGQQAGDTFNLVAPVPEASTVVSFGALLALGGLAVVLRRKGVKSAV